MTKKHISGLMVVLLLAMTACAGLTHKRNDAALAKVKKVAVVGFHVRQPRGVGIPKANYQETEEMYKGLQATFAKKMKWQVVPTATMANNPGYKAAYERTMKGFQNKMPVADTERQLMIEGVMDNDSLRIMGASGRTALMKSLGVDALVTAEIKVLLSGTKIMGIGANYPWTRLSFQVFTPNQDTPDWFEGGLDGQEAKQSIGATAFIDRDLMNKLALESARTAFNRIGEPRN